MFWTNAKPLTIVYYRFMPKHLGGRGRRTDNKFQTITISLPPELKALLDSWASKELNRSQVVAQLIEAQAQRQGVPSAAVEPVEPRSLPTAAQTPSRPAGEPTAPRRDHHAGKTGQRGQTVRLALSAPVLHVMQRTMPRGQKWTPAKYAQAEALLRQGDVLQAQGVDYVTEQGQVMSWRTAEALVKLGILVVPPQ